MAMALHSDGFLWRLLYMAMPLDGECLYVNGRRFCMLIVLYGDGFLWQWFCMLMVMFGNGFVRQWFCMAMVLYGTGSVW